MEVSMVSIYLLGGPSSVGKTTLANDLAVQLNIAVLHVDDIVHASDDPTLRAACSRLNVENMSPGSLREVLIAKGDALTPLLDRLIQSRLEEGWQGIIEGEGIQPELALKLAHDHRVRCTFVIEENEERLLETLRLRPTGSGEPRDMSSGIPAKAARMDARYGQWLRQEASRHELHWLASHPFETLAARFLAAVS